MTEMLRRQFLVRCLGLTGLPLVSACASERFALGIHSWIGYEPLMLAQQFGWLPHGVVLIEGRSALDTLARLRQGQLDAGALTLDETLAARVSGVPLTVVLVFNVSAGADMVLARPEIKTLADLTGKRIAVERSAVGALMLVKTLAAAGLDESALQVIDLPVADQLAAWRQGRIDAAISYEPVASLLRREGAVILYDSRHLPDTIFDVLAVRRDRMAGRGRLLRRLIEGHFRAIDHLRINREDAIYRIASRQQTLVDEVRRALGGVVLPGLESNHAYLKEGSAFHEAAKRLATLMHARGLLPMPDRLEGLFDGRFLPVNVGRP